MSTVAGDQKNDPVTVTAGDYAYFGWVVAKFAKRSGQLRVVVEDENGRLFIHNLSQLIPKSA